MNPRLQSFIGGALALLGWAGVAPLAADSPAVAGEPGCLPGGGGRLEMQVSGAFEARLSWPNEGTRCEGGPRPAGDALRLMFSRADEALLVVIGITGLERGAVGQGMPANLTMVREGKGEFYGTLGADACIVTVTLNEAEPGLADAWRVSGHGECTAPVEAIARDGEIRLAPFAFTGLAFWPDEAEED